jgi:protein TonB
MPKRPLLAIVSLLAAACSAAQTPSPPADAASPDAVQAEQLAQLEQTQRELLQDLRRQLAQMPESVRKQRLRSRIAEVEGRANAPRDLYISPGAKMSAPMRTYYARMRQRIEDCGTRHFPSQDGRKLYGQGIVGITLANDGSVAHSEVLESSKDPALDGHMLKLVQASAPFGTPPAKPLANGSQTYRRLVVITGFDFNQDGSKPLPEPVQAKDRCQWK